MRYLSDRLTNNPISEENFNLEHNIINQININNGYKILVINLIISRKLYRQYLNLPNSKHLHIKVGEKSYILLILPFKCQLY